jgi:hypothetical protein
MKQRLTDLGQSISELWDRWSSSTDILWAGVGGRSAEKGVNAEVPISHRLGSRRGNFRVESEWVALVKG